MLLNELPNPIDLFARIASTPLKANRIEPELRLAFIPLDGSAPSHRRYMASVSSRIGWRNASSKCIRR